MEAWGADEQKKYWEAEMQRKVLYVPNLSNYLNLLNLQILKLPHELKDPSVNLPTGTTYQDIVNSVCNGVDLAYAIIAPIRREQEEINKGTHKKWTKGEAKDLKLALEKLEWIYNLLDDADALNDRVIAMELPDVEYDANDRPMPSPVEPPVAKAVGEVEGKDKRPVAKKDLE